MANLGRLCPLTMPPFPSIPQSFSQRCRALFRSSWKASLHSIESNPIQSLSQVCHAGQTWPQHGHGHNVLTATERFAHLAHCVPCMRKAGKACSCFFLHARAGGGGRLSTNATSKSCFTGSIHASSLHVMAAWRIRCSWLHYAFALCFFSGGSSASGVFVAQSAKNFSMPPGAAP